MDERQRKREISNTIGIWVLIVLTFAIVVVEGGKALFRQADRRKTVLVLDDAGARFATGDKEAMFAWARGEFRDAWDESIEIGLSNRAEIQMVSKGPNKVLGDQDDVYGDTFPIVVQQPVVFSSTVALKKSLDDAKEVITDKIEEAKKSAADGKVQGKGWHIEWHWGKRKIVPDGGKK